MALLPCLVGLALTHTYSKDFKELTRSIRIESIQYKLLILNNLKIVYLLDNLTISNEY